MKHILIATLAAAYVSLMASCDRFTGAQDEHDHEHEEGDEHDHDAEAQNARDDHEHQGEGEDEHDHAAEGDERAEGEEDHHDHGAEVMLSGEAIARAGIMVAPVERVMLRPTLNTPARISFNLEAMAQVGTAIPGRIVEIRSRVGEEVSEGDVLLAIQSAALGEAQIDVLRKSAVLEASRPAQDIAQRAFDRARSLQESNSGVTLTEVQDREAHLREAEAAVLMAEAEFNAARESLRLLGFDQSRIDALLETGEIDPLHSVRAPIAGQVIQRDVTLGEHLDPEDEALYIIADLSTLWVLADVPETYLDRIAINAAARITGAATESPIEGTVSYIAPSVDRHTRAGQVRIEVAGDSDGLRPGVFAQAEIETAGEEMGGPMVVVPEAALQTLEGETVVFVPIEGEEGVFAPRHVEIGAIVGGMIPILAGLEEGELVVIAGSFILKAEIGKGEAGHGHDH